MRKQAPTLEWSIVENDTDWERQKEPPLPAGEPAAHRHWPRSFWSGAALFLLLVSAGEWWWRTTQVRAQQAGVEAMASAQQELGNGEQVGGPAAASPPGEQPAWAGDQTGSDWNGQQQVAQPDDPLAPGSPADQQSMAWWDQQGRTVSSLLATVQTADPKAQQDIKLHTVEVQGDQAVVSIVTTAKRGAPAYRQTLFYQRTGERWQRTEPNAALWGPARTLETPSVVFHFRQTDAPAVIAVAPQVEALYTTLRHNFDLLRAPAAAKLVIEVDVTHPLGHASPWGGGPDRIAVPSPAVYWAPVELTEAELLAQALALALPAHLLAQASDHHAIGSTWQPLLGGLHLWQVWDLDLLLAVWRETVVQWSYGAGPAVAPGQTVVLPDRYEALCAAHTRWLPAPVRRGLPLFCTALDGQQWYFVAWGPRAPFLRLDQLTLSLSPAEDVGQSSASSVPHPGQTVALATLIEYAVATFGRERLPALVAGLGQYESWETLLPAVYGVSPAAFEAGWQAYLAEHYAVSLP